MKNIRKGILFLMILVIISIISLKLIYHPFRSYIYDGFENAGLSNKWSDTRIEPSSFEIESEIVRKGNSAAKITLKYGDKVEFGYGKNKDSERDELLERRSLYAIEGKEYEYLFSMFLPDSFPIMPVRLVIAQWKQDCPFCDCSEYSPVLAIRYVSGRMFITIQTDSMRHELYSTNEEIRDKWLDFRFKVRFSKDKTGEIIGYLDNNEIINFKGVTSYSNNCRILSTKNKYYFKMGLYRDRIEKIMSIYIDEYSKKRLDQK
jgi:hypothetical protein